MSPTTFVLGAWKHEVLLFNPAAQIIQLPGLQYFPGKDNELLYLLPGLYLTQGGSFHSYGGGGGGAAREGGTNFLSIATQKISSLKLQRNILQHQQINS